MKIALLDNDWQGKKYFDKNTFWGANPVDK
jgi:hypothetical protein